MGFCRAGQPKVSAIRRLLCSTHPHPPQRLQRPGKVGLRSGINDADRTWLAIVPLGSHRYAARLGFADPFAEPMPIIGAAISLSTSYDPVLR